MLCPASNRRFGPGGDIARPGSRPPNRTQLANMFWPSGTMSLIISVAGVLIFSGLIAYETRRSTTQYAEA